MKIDVCVILKIIKVLTLMVVYIVVQITSWSCYVTKLESNESRCIFQVLLVVLDNLYNTSGGDKGGTDSMHFGDGAGQYLITLTIDAEAIHYEY